MTYHLLLKNDTQLTELHVKIGRQVANCYRGGTNDPQTICKQSANGLSIVRMVELDSPWNRFHCETYECVKAMSATICKCVMITCAGHQYSRSYTLLPSTSSSNIHMASLEAVTVKSFNFYPFGILCEMFRVQRFIL